MPVERKYEGRTIACIATGPSLTQQQVDTAREKGFILVGCNRTWEVVPDLAALYACNVEFWSHYWSDALASHAAHKWTTNAEARDKFGINWIDERNSPGLSSDPKYIHHGHGSGYSLVNLAYLMGSRRIVLLGYDLKYARDYSGVEKRVGSTPRHYFGEYPSSMQHWPSAKIKNGVHVELVQLYESVARQGLVEIINCTPGSAADCFPKLDIRDVV